MWYKLKRIMMWVNNQEKQVRPKEGARTLFDETDFKNSSYSKNWYFLAAWRWWGSSFTQTAYDTANWRIYSTGSHSYAWIRFNSSSYNVIGDAKKIKIVYDYIFVANNTNRYGSWVILFLWELSKSSYWYGYNSYQSITHNPEFTDIIDNATEYSCELVYDLKNDTWTMTSTKISDGSKKTSTIGNLSTYWTTSSMFVGTSDRWSIWWQVRDQWIASYFWDMHVYYIN